MHSELLEIIPATLRPFVNKFIFRNKPLDVCMSYFGPIFQERQNLMKDGKYRRDVKPDDGFQWVIDTCPPDTSIGIMVKKLLFIFTAGTYTIAVAGTHCVHDFAAMPHFQGPVREEIAQELGAASTVKETKEAWVRMRRLDSVLRESARMNGTHLGTVMRKFMILYTFSDGMEIPKGAWVVGASSTIHRTSVYEDPDTFDGFRFSKMREEAGMGDRFS
jgi:cytochrome P450